MTEMGLAHYRTLDAGERGSTSHVMTRAREKRSGRPAMLREQHEEHQRSHNTFQRKVLVRKRVGGCRPKRD
jgi:hypothetical protein